MKEGKDKKDTPIISMSDEEKEGMWDSVYEKEEGIILEFNMDSKSGKVQSLNDNTIYKIDSRELTRTNIELRQGDKVLFAHFEDPDGDNYARIIRIIELKA